eukprot:14888763-Alexandrium_andersonii.AAC.1
MAGIIDDARAGDGPEGEAQGLREALNHLAGGEGTSRRYEDRRGSRGGCPGARISGKSTSLPGGPGS